MQEIVVKYGGNAMADLAADPVLADCVELHKGGQRVVLVHGGGPQIDAALRTRGIKEERIDGLRVTSLAALEIVEHVLCATVNKELVRALGALGATAVGISGEDGRLLWAKKIDRRLGAVGEIVEVQPQVIRTILDAGFFPVIAPLALDKDDPSGRLNVNADTAAGAIAGALQAQFYVVVTDVEGVRKDLTDPNSTVARLTAAQATAWLDDGTLSGGMRPKMRGALDALQHGAKRALISGAGVQAITRALEGTGTEVTL
ncbi:MAG TPA: acetylglutamate kinase [Candidatus Binatia bacterium]|nr:acetylglutamate kinase [Candidatus Binatia bacterium]